MGATESGSAYSETERLHTLTRASSDLSVGRMGNVVAGLRARKEDVAQAVYEHILATVPDPVSDADRAHQEGLRTTIGLLLDYTFDAIADGEYVQRPVPDAAKIQACRAARAGMSLGLIMRRYLSAHRYLGGFITEEAIKFGLAQDGAAMHELRYAQETLLECLIAAVEQAYNQESECIDQTPMRRRLVTVHRLLNDEPIGMEEIIELRYEIDDIWHVGVIAEGEGAEQAISAVQRGFGCKLLSIVGGNRSVWAWFGAKRKLSARRIGAHLPAPSRIRLALGEPRSGLEGFRRTHAEALAAQRIAHKRTASMIHCADVTLDAALLADPLLFRLHQETYLSPLDSLRNKGQAARETLTAYFACEQNIVATGRRLKVSRKTVENRLQQIAIVLELPLHACLPELQVALRLEAFASDERANGFIDRSPRAGSS